MRRAGPVGPIGSSPCYLLENRAKLVGIITGLAYFARPSRSAVGRRLRTP